MDITKSFTSDSCRTCNITYNDLQTFFEPTLINSNKSKINKVREYPPSHTFKDLVQRKFFYAVDLFHDFTSKGIIQKVLGALMQVHYQDINVRNSRNLVKFKNIKKFLKNLIKWISEMGKFIS